MNADYCTPQNGAWNNGYFISRIGPDDPMEREPGYEMTEGAIRAEEQRSANGPTVARHRREFKKRFDAWQRGLKGKRAR